ncbi:MAG: hypothetical protein NVSMB2_22730 [Chloroflexota bacterium]
MMRLARARTVAHDRRLSGQALVEFAITLPLFALFVFTVIQLSLLFVAYYSETRMARETARWLAIHGQVTDDIVLGHVQNTMLPGLLGGTAVAQSGSTATDPIYMLGSGMTVTFTGCGVTSAPCTNSHRASGNILYVTMQYNAANLLFLPSTFRLGTLTVSVPTTLPAYRVKVMVE